VERAKGVEPSLSAWEAGVMPLYDARTFFQLAGNCPTEPVFDQAAHFSLTSAQCRIDRMRRSFVTQYQ
jgi:hypothetical protein